MSNYAFNSRTKALCTFTLLTLAPAFRGQIPEKEPYHIDQHGKLKDLHRSDTSSWPYWPWGHGS